MDRSAEAVRLITSRIPRALIDAEIRAATYPGHSPARWALPLLDELEREGDGNWTRVALDEDELGDVWLPEHAGEPCHGDACRLGDAAGGMRLRDAAAWLAEHEAAYAAASPSCWGRIAHASGEPATVLVLSQWSVGDRVKPDAAEFVVVDGLHRALGYWLSGRRTCEAYLIGRGKS